MKPYQIDAIVGEYDLDDSGEIDFEEFIVMMIKLLGRRVRCDLINYREYLTEPLIEKYEQHFREADTSGDGALDKTELQNMLTKINVTLNDRQLDEIIGEVDKDNSNSIEKRELLQYIQRTAPPLAASFRFRICSCTARGVQYVMIYARPRRGVVVREPQRGYCQPRKQSYRPNSCSGALLLVI